MGFDRLIEALRRPQLDQLKARRLIRHQSEAAFREAVGDYDTFVPLVSEVSAPSFLVGTARTFTGESVPVHLSLRDLDSHWMVTGSTGSGKSRFVTGLLTCLLQSHLGVAVIDCKEGFFEAAIRWLGVLAFRLPPEARAAFVARVTVIDLFSRHLTPLNFCQRIPGSSVRAQASDITLALERLFEAGFSHLMATIMRWLLVLLVSAELTLAEATLVLEDDVLRGVLVERSGIRPLQEFFFRTYAAMPDPPKTALRMRLHALFFSESLLPVGTDEMVDFRRTIERGDILVVSLGTRGPEEDTKVVGNLLLQTFARAAYTAGRHPLYTLIIDEFFQLVDAPNLAGRFESWLTTMRSFNLSLCLALHQFCQVPPALRETLIANCNLNVVFRSSARNAEYLADFAPSIEPAMVMQAIRTGTKLPSAAEIRRSQMERLQRLPRQEFWWYDRRQPYRALQVRGSDVPDPHVAAGVSEGELDRFIADIGLGNGTAALTREQIHDQIARRRGRLERLLRPPVAVRLPDERPAVPAGHSRNSRPKLG